LGANEGLRFSQNYSRYVGDYVVAFGD
jgi:hypothetical protein